MCNSMLAFALRVLLYLANVFLTVSFVLFCINFQVNSLDYYQTTRIYRIVCLVYLIVLILLGAVCCRKARLPSAIYELYLATLFVAVAFSAIFLVFDLDKTETVTQQLRNDVDYFNKHNESIARLDQLQSEWKCCGVTNYTDFTSYIPASCVKTNKTSSSKISWNGWERRLFIEEYQEDPSQAADGVDFIEETSEAKNRKQRDSVFVPHLGRIKTDKAGDDEGSPDEDEEPKEYYPLGCLAKLEQTHMSQRSISVKLLLTVASSSFASIIIIFLLIYVRKN